MDPRRIVEALRATLDENHQKEAENLLNEVHKIIGFTPMLLQIVMADDMEIPVRQAGVIYFKNTVTQSWTEKEADKPGDPVPFSVHEQDRQHIRERIVEAIIAAPVPIRVQLKRALEHVIKSDFPGRWHDFPQKLMTYMASEDQAHLFGSLLSVHCLVKVYEYKKADERDPLLMVMQTMLPALRDRLQQFVRDDSEFSCNVQKLILKIFHTLTQVFLPLNIITKDGFEQWMELFKSILERDVPASTLQTAEDERGDLIWWKCKKWVMHILTRIFGRYGNPGHVSQTYAEFAQWFLKRFSPSIIAALLNICQQFRCGVFVAPRVLQQTLNYFSTAVGNCYSWNLLKVNFSLLLEEVIFPLLCHSESDQELWDSDQHEYIRSKADILEDLVSPSSAAWQLLHESCSKRKNVLAKTMTFATHILVSVGSNEDNTSTAQNPSPVGSLTPPRQKDGALHIIGSLAELLVRKKMYEEQMEPFIVNFVFPVFASQHGFLRARGCWILAQLTEVKLNNHDVMRQSMEVARQALSDKDLPVRTAAASCIKALLADHRTTSISEFYKGLLRPHLETLFKDLLNLIRETETDDMNTVLQEIVCVFEEEIAPVALHMTQHLADTFRNLIRNQGDGIDGDRDEEERSYLAMGILNTLEAILTACEDHKEIMSQLESVVVQIVGAVLHDRVSMYYDEVLSLASSLTSNQISPVMWQIYDLVYGLFSEENGMDYFTDVMPALHNYVTLDKDAFLAEPRRMEMALTMCSKVLSENSNAGEDAECHAAKLLEVILLDYRGRIDTVVPAIVGMALQRLVRPVLTELRTMCLQVGIAGLYYDPNMMLNVLNQTAIPESGTSVLEIFVKQWLSDVDCFLGIHDRKMCVIGICILLSLPGDRRPEIVSKGAHELMPSLILLFNGLKRAYSVKAAANASGDDDDSSEEEEEEEAVELDSDEDEIDEDSVKYRDRMEKMANGDGDGESDEEEDDDFEDGETQLEYYVTHLDEEDNGVDEYNIFRSTLQDITDRDHPWYQAVTHQLTAEQWEGVKDVIKIAEQRQQQQESKRIEEAGGYSFNQTAVPSNFNFGGNFPQE